MNTQSKRLAIESLVRVLYAAITDNPSTCDQRTNARKIVMLTNSLYASVMLEYDSNCSDDEDGSDVESLGGYTEDVLDFLEDLPLHMEKMSDCSDDESELCNTVGVKRRRDFDDQDYAPRRRNLVRQSTYKYRRVQEFTNDESSEDEEEDDKAKDEDYTPSESDED